MEKWLLNQEKELSDDLVWTSFKNGDNRSLNTLLLRYFRPLLHYGTKFTRDRLLIEDVIQDLFLNLLERRDKLSAPASVKNYLFKSLRNNLIRAVRTKNEDFPLSDQYDELTDFGNIETLLVSMDESEELSTKIGQYFTHLTKRQKEVLFLRYYENRTNEEIAEIMGINKQSVSNLLQKSISILRENWVSMVFFFYTTHSLTDI